MKPLTLTVIAVISFLVSFFAAWRPAPPDKPRIAGPKRTPSLSTAAPQTATAAAGRLLTEMERQLSLSLDGGGPYSGERLAELCAGMRRNEALAFDTVALYADGWAKTDPAGMHQWFAARGDFDLPTGGGFGFTFKSTVFAAWAETDPAAALAAAAAHKDGGGALGAAISALLRTDPARALGAAQQHLARLANAWASQLDRDAPGTWEMLCALPPGADRGRLMASWLQSGTAAEETAAELERIWREAPDAVRRDLVAAGFSLLVDEPRDLVVLEGLEDMARAHAEQSATPETVRRFLSAHGGAWAERDPAAAVQWAMGHLQGLARVNQTTELFRHAAGNFEAALAAWHDLPAGILKARAAGALAAGAPADRAAEARQLLDALPPADRRAADAEAMEQRRAR